MTDPYIWIERYRRRLAWGRFFERFAEWLAAFLFLFGGLVLIAKLAMPTLWPHVLWAAAGVVVAGIGASWVASRGGFTTDESAALLDNRLGTGGLLMMLQDVPRADWQAHLPDDEATWSNIMPRLRPARFARLLLLPIAFAVGACFVPLREARAEPTLLTSTGLRTTDTLTDVVDDLEELELLEEREREEIREEIERIQETAKKGPLEEENWEAVDALRQRLATKIADGLVQVEKAARAAAMLARATDPAAQPLTPERTAQLQEDLAETLRKMGERGDFKGGSKELQDALQRLMKNGKLDLPEDAAARQKLLDELKDHLAGEIEKLGECRGQCEGGRGQRPGEGLGGRFGDGPDGDGPPGRGGISRGRGDAPITFGDESDEQGAKFKAVILPPGFLEDPDNRVIGTTSHAPEVDPAKSAPRGEAAGIDLATGNETATRPLRPRHRDVVKKYFGER